MQRVTIKSLLSSPYMVLSNPVTKDHSKITEYSPLSVNNVHYRIYIQGMRVRTISQDEDTGECTIDYAEVPAIQESEDAVVLASVERATEIAFP